jgi:hypothetical protein
MQEILMVLLAAAAFVIVFSLFWAAIVWLISRLSGWARLARQYPAVGPVAGDVFHWCSARFGLLSSHRSCLTVTVSPRGVHMQPVIFFQMGHNPIFIPWTAVLQFERDKIWLISCVRLRIKNTDNGRSTSIVIYGRGVVESLVQHFPGE